jgi:hypothetical protein
LLEAWSGPGDLGPKLLGWSSCHAAAPPHTLQTATQAVHLQHKHTGTILTMAIIVVAITTVTIMVILLIVILLIVIMMMMIMKMIVVVAVVVVVIVYLRFRLMMS